MISFRFLGFEFSVRREAMVTPPPVPRFDSRSFLELEEEAGGLARLVVHLGGSRLRRWLGDALVGRRPGQIAALLGPAGCGKSTLINALRGLPHSSLQLVDGGEVALDSQRACLVATNCVVPMGAAVFECSEPWLHAFDRYELDVFALWLTHHCKPEVL